VDRIFSANEQREMMTNEIDWDEVTFGADETAAPDRLQGAESQKEFRAVAEKEGVVVARFEDGIIRRSTRVTTANSKVVWCFEQDRDDARAALKLRPDQLKVGGAAEVSGLKVTHIWFKLIENVGTDGKLLADEPTLLAHPDRPRAAVAVSALRMASGTLQMEVSTVLNGVVVARKWSSAAEVASLRRLSTARSAARTP
jgi:hypothetical protein